MKPPLAAAVCFFLVACVGATGLELSLLQRDFERLRAEAAASGDWVGTMIGTVGAAVVGAAGGATVARRKKTRGAQ